jgi:hypothetical protein
MLCKRSGSAKRSLSQHIRFCVCAMAPAATNTVDFAAETQ